MKGKKISLNLATHPQRNRRFFYLLVWLMSILFLVVSFYSGQIYLSSRAKMAGVRASVTEKEQLVRDAQRKEREFIKNITAEEKKSKEKVEFINGIILRKSFSWVKFLGDLESALPDSSYIVSLAPRLVSDSVMEVRFRVISQNLNDLIKFYNNLRSLNFSNIRIESETENKMGYLTSEISLRYERII